MKIKFHYSNKKIQSYLKKISMQDCQIFLDFNKNMHQIVDRSDFNAYGRATISLKLLQRDLNKIKQGLNVKSSYLVTITAGLNLSFKDYELICYYLSADGCRVKLQTNMVDKIDVAWLAYDHQIISDPEAI